MNDPKVVYKLEHVRAEDTPNQVIRFLGVFESEEDGNMAILAYKRLPGFCEHPEGFYLTRCILGERLWSTGFLGEAGVKNWPWPED